MENIELKVKVYEETTGLQREILDCMIIKFVGINRYNIDYKLTFYGVSSNTGSAMQKTIKSLVSMGLMAIQNDEYIVDPNLCIRLLPELLRDQKYRETALIIQNDERYHYNPSVLIPMRNYLFGGLVEQNSYTTQAIEKLTLRVSEVARLFLYLMELPAYDKIISWSPRFLHCLLDEIHLINLLDFKDFKVFINFLSRQTESKDLLVRMNTTLMEISFQMGKAERNLEMLNQYPGDQALLLRSQVELFNGNFESSEAFFDLARKAGRPGNRGPGIDYHVYFEFFYWLNFVFRPDTVNLKKIDSAIKRRSKIPTVEGYILLTLLHFIKKDRLQAERFFDSLNRLKLFRDHAYQSLFYLILHYLLHSRLAGDLRQMTLELSIDLFEAKRFIYLREVVWMARQSGFETETRTIAAVDRPDAPPCLMSRISSQEKWEEMLDGLLNLARTRVTSVKKEPGASRVGYLVSVEHKVIQPILQTANAKGVWSAGRNISLKRFKDQTIEELTDQDRKVANAITHQSGYYQANQYFLDFDKAVVDLCGHPFLFLFNNPGVSVELVRTQPEIITEQVKSGIRLKTNISDSVEGLIIIKETQTRYMVIRLTPNQEAIIRMIRTGVTVPERGKEKLLATIAGLSGLLTVHSDLVNETAAAKTVDADSRIRVQVLPYGDGLRVEAFVKPLGAVPPYLKPGVGGRMIYGNLDGEKLQAVRDPTAEKINAETLATAISIRTEADIFKEPVNFSDPFEILELLDVMREYSAISVVEWPKGEKFGIKRSANWSHLRLHVSSKASWFELEGELTIDESSVISLNELLMKSHKSKGRFIELKPGEFLALEDTFKKQLDELASTVTVNRSGIIINRFVAPTVDEFVQKAGTWNSDKKWKEFQKLLNAGNTLKMSVPQTLDGELRPYQEEGFHWMARLNSWGAGACLADDMGLGKTIQAIAMMLHLSDKGPALVVCPASVISNWGHELASFAPSIRPVGLKQGNRTSVFAALGPQNVLIISYGLLQTEQSEIERIKWSMAILDEAHAIKNTHTKSSKSAMSIQAGFKLVLTGTPIQNHLGELWNLFNFSNPGLLGTQAQFTDRYIKNDNPAQKHHLKKLITPFILRRTKNKVLDELPPKTEITFPVQLSDHEMAFYEALRREAVATIENGSGPMGQQHLQALAELTRLRLACCNTLLVDKNIAIPSAKLEAFMEITAVLRANNHRALVFSQFVTHLTLVRAELDRTGIGYQYLDGSTTLPDRERAVQAFQSGKGELFLISLKAGGLGLNLTAADFVIHLDPWWNPAVEDQASDRAHRIGQAKPVTIYRLVAANTIEEKIVRLHHTKRDLADSLLEGTDRSAQLSTTDLLEFIREG